MDNSIGSLVRGKSTRITPMADDGEEVSKEVVAVAPIQVKLGYT